MEFKEASDFVLKFGKHKGRKLGEVGAEDDGLRYLDWMAELDNLYPDTRQALDAYMSDPAIAKELEGLCKKR